MQLHRLKFTKNEVEQFAQYYNAGHSIKETALYFNKAYRDILHYLEVTPITRSGAIELINELQNLRIERRYMKQMWELWNVYGKNRMKLGERNHRDFLIAELHKEDKSLQTTYNFRQYTKEELDAMNEDKSLPRKRKGEIISNNEIFSSYNNNEEEIIDGE